MLRYGTAATPRGPPLTYAIVVAVAAGAVRAVDVPRLLGPAVLTLVFYLWDALHGTAPARRREPRFLWELAAARRARRGGRRMEPPAARLTGPDGSDGASAV